MLGDKIKQAMAAEKITSKELAKDIGISPTYLSYILNNKRTNPSMDVLNKIAKKLGVTTSYLINEDNSFSLDLLCALESAYHYNSHDGITDIYKFMEYLSKKLSISYDELAEVVVYHYKEYSSNTQIKLINDFKIIDYKRFLDFLKYNTKDIEPEVKSFLSENNSGNVDIEEKISIKNFKNIPIVGVVRAGQPILAVENIESYIPLPKSLFDSDKVYFALRVKGDSMNLEFKEGSLLIIEQSSCIENGQIGIVLINGNEATVKKVIQNKNMITLIPMSNNPIYTPKMYDIVKDQVSIVGIVRHAIKSY